MKDKMIPEVVMSILYSRSIEYENNKIINSPFTETSNDYKRNVSVTLSYLKEVLEDIFGTEEE
jgi:hypothetical protein